MQDAFEHDGPPPVDGGQHAFTLHAVTQADAEELAALRVRAMRPSLEAVGRYDETRARRRLLDGFDAGCTHEIRAGNTRAGFLVLRAAVDGWWLDHFYIDPAHQGCGLGSAVLRQIVARARAAGVALRLCALTGSRSNAFYRRHGFVVERQTEWDTFYGLADAGPVRRDTAER